MNTMDLQAMGLTEMNETEIREVNGGFGWIVVGFLGYLAWDCIMNPSDALAQIEAGYNSK